MKISVKSGATLAAAAAALVIGGALAVPSSAIAKPIKCSGINACKGKSACKGGRSPGKGLNECMGHGWLSVKDKNECTRKRGDVIS